MRRVAQRGALGRFGESFTCAELKRRGYDLLERNMRFRTGEIDIVAEQGGEIVFVEVKTRRVSTFSVAEDAFGGEQTDHLEAAIAEYFEAYDLPGRSYRIEWAIVEVDPSGRVARFELTMDPGLR
ncbi:MAG TPA: YraN family protein [Chloroflexota bacterium]|nr:YraN family protein [Chloroflexota bacterium]